MCPREAPCVQISCKKIPPPRLRRQRSRLRGARVGGSKAKACGVWRQPLEPKVVPPSFSNIMAQCGGSTPLLARTCRRERSVERSAAHDGPENIILSPGEGKAASSRRTPKPRGTLPVLLIREGSLSAGEIGPIGPMKALPWSGRSLMWTGRSLMWSGRSVVWGGRSFVWGGRSFVWSGRSFVW